MSTLSIDFETRSVVDLKVAGVYPYAAHPDTDIWCMAWAFEGEEPEIWTPDMVEWHGVPVPDLTTRVYDHIRDGGEIRAWNAQFERIIWREIMVKRYGAPEVTLQQWVDTAAEAAAMSLPRGLDKAAEVCGVPMQKDAAGYRLMLQMSRPRSFDNGKPIWWDVPEKKAKLFAYCQQDVRTEQSLVPALRRLPERERELYLLDQRINDRGMMLDRELVLAAKDVAGVGVERANTILDTLTKGAVTTVTNNGDMKRWLASEGVVTDSIAKAAVKELLEGELPPAVREALVTRADAGRTSIAKLDSMLEVSGEDDRARGLKLYHGASTGRWSGKLLQPDNFPRGSVAGVEQYIDLVLAREYDTLNVFYHPVEIISSMLRAMLRAAPGNVFTVADFSAIEARVLNWLAGQQDVLDNFRAYDAGDKDRDPYKVMAGAIFRKAASEITKAERQPGKAAELGCGFQMGWKKFKKAAWDVYQVRVDDEQAQLAVSTYRETHPFVKQLWDDANAAAMRAVTEFGSVQEFGGLKNLKFTARGSYLYLILPAKRPLVYAAPRIVDRLTPWGEVRPSVEVWGTNSLTRQWEPTALYGGLIIENAVQAVARDLLADSMQRCESRGYPVVMHVHDEIITEVPAHFGSVEELESIMRELPEWAAGCPIAAEGWRGERYRK